MEDADRVINRRARKMRPPRLISCVSVRYEPYGVFVAPPEPLPPVCPAGTLTLMSVLLRRVRPPQQDGHQRQRTCWANGRQWLRRRDEDAIGLVPHRNARN